MSDCKDCTEKKESKFNLKRAEIIKELEHRYENITVAIAETKNGSTLTYREVGDPSLQRLKIREYISIINGVALG